MLDGPRADLGRLCRQIWIDHERSPHGSLENDFAAALAEVQRRHGDAAPGEDELWEIVRGEHDRVAQAAAVAEILLPRISALLREKAPSPARPIPNGQPTSPEPSARPAASSIADFIEGMLDQERVAARRAGSSHRS